MLSRPPGTLQVYSELERPQGSSNSNRSSSDCKTLLFFPHMRLARATRLLVFSRWNPRKTAMKNAIVGFGLDLYVYNFGPFSPCGCLPSWVTRAFFPDPKPKPFLGRVWRFCDLEPSSGQSRCNLLHSDAPAFFLLAFKGLGCQRRREEVGSLHNQAAPT